MESSTATKPLGWSAFVLAGFLVAIVLGAIWFKTQSALRLSDGSLLEQGMSEHRAGNLEAALVLYQKALRSDPANPWAHYNIGQIHNERARYAEAEREYEESLKIDPSFIDARINLGVALYRQGKLRQAAAAFGEALQAQPKNPFALFNLGVTLLEMGEPEAAVRWLREALEINPGRADLHYYLGLAYRKSGKLDQARDAFQTAGHLEKGHAAARAALAEVDQSHSAPRQKQKTPAKSVKLDPKARN